MAFELNFSILSKTMQHRWVDFLQSPVSGDFSVLGMTDEIDTAGVKRQKIEYIHSKCGKRTVTRLDDFLRNPRCMNFDCVELRRKQTMVKRYGVEYSAQSKIIIEKRKKTLLKKYGVDNVAKIPGIQLRRMVTNQSKYGWKTPLGDKDVRDKATKTVNKRYGVTNPFQVEEVKEKSRRTLMLRYGVTNPARSIEIQKRIKDTRREKSLSRIKGVLKDYGYELVDDFKGVTLAEQDRDGSKCHIRHTVRHIDCGKVFMDDIFGVPRCPVCHPLYGTHRSKLEGYYSKFLESLGARVETSRRDLLTQNRQVDIFLPEYGVAFEINGLYYHSVNGQANASAKSLYYHRDKTDDALKNNIKLYHIWENVNPEVVKSQMRVILGKADRVYARNTEIKRVGSEEKKAFFVQNHVHGDTQSLISWGLFLGEELMMLISLRATRNGMEIARMATKRNCVVVGGYSKLLKKVVSYAKERTKVLITYADRDWSPDSATVYGEDFVLKGDTGPSMFYTDFKQVWSRQKFQKHKLKELFSDFYKDRLSEQMILSQAGIYPCYTSGNWKYEMCCG